MATATAQDDDILIIADDNESSETEQDIEFSFDFGDDTSKEEVNTKEAPTTQEAEVSMTEESDSSLNSLLSEETQAQAEVTIPEVASQEDESDLAMSFDTPAADVVEEETQKEMASTDETFSFDLESNSVQTDPAAQASDTASMNDILSATIAKLVARQEAIVSDKAEKSTKEEELKEKIKDLQAQVRELESDMATLDNESDKITANITQLEEMKLDPVKEHNAKRAVKK